MTWRSILAFGLTASAAIAGCTVTATSGGMGDGGPAGTGGATGTGGASSGGATGTGGASSGGATTGTGGSGTGGAKTDAGDAGRTQYTQAEACAAQTDDKACATCVKARCCEEWTDCVNDKDCYTPSAADGGEFSCLVTCLGAQFNDAGTFDEGVCEAKCQHDTAAMAPATSALVTCIRAVGDAGAEKCSTQCFNGPL